MASVMLILWILILAFILEGVGHMVVGSWVPESKLRRIIGEHRQEYVDSGTNGRRSMLYGLGGNPFIAHTPTPIASSKYYIHGHGLVPRWSPWTKEIDKLFVETPVSKWG